jgi:hypothetical protein
MRVGMGNLADFIPGSFALPQNPVRDAMRGVGLGDFVPGRFVVPQNPVLDASKYAGMSGCGCGCGGGCGGGMGQIDWSLTSTSIGTEIGIPEVPNWLLYMGVIGTAALIYSQSEKKRGRR